METMVATRRCKDCDEDKPLDQFSASHRGYFESYCKPCKALRSKQRYEDVDGHDPLSAHRQRDREARRKNRYGITPEQYDALFEKQNGCCAMCGRPETIITSGKVWDLSVDHDHSCCPGRKSCGECIRALLCNRCNTMLGLAGDDLDRLWAGIEYLISTRAPEGART